MTIDGIRLTDLGIISYLSTHCVSIPTHLFRVLKYKVLADIVIINLKRDFGPQYLRLDKLSNHNIDA